MNHVMLYIEDDDNNIASPTRAALKSCESSPPRRPRRRSRW